MTHVLEAWQDCNGVLETLSLDFPVFFVTDSMDFFSDIKNTLRIMICNCIQDIQTVDSNIDSGIAQTNKSIVEENVKPLLIESFLIRYQKGMASVHNFIVLQIFLEWLNHLDSHLKVMMAVAVNKFANVLPFWCWLND